MPIVTECRFWTMAHVYVPTDPGFNAFCAWACGPALDESAVPAAPFRVQGATRALALNFKYGGRDVLLPQVCLCVWGNTVPKTGCNFLGHMAQNHNILA